MFRFPSSTNSAAIFRNERRSRVKDGKSYPAAGDFSR
jgi:hypothetical protein